MTPEEKFQKIRECIGFASNTRPYLLTDDEENELREFMHELERALPREQESYRAYDIELRDDEIGVEAIISQHGEEITIFAGTDDDDAMRGAKLLIDEWHRAP